MRSRPVLAALVITAVFMLARHGMNAAFGPVVGVEGVDWGAWFTRDLWKTLPRLGALAACLWAMGDPRRRDWSAPAAAGAALAALTTIGHTLSFGEGTPFTNGQKLIGALATVPVAVWEELCYRGLLYRGLRDGGRTPLAAAALSTTAFTVMHWGAIPVDGWSLIFMNGFAFCGALELGAGLPLLMFAHWFIDSYWFWAVAQASGGVASLSKPLMLAACAWTAWALRARRDGAPGPSRPESPAPRT